MTIRELLLVDENYIIICKPYIYNGYDNPNTYNYHHVDYYYYCISSYYNSFSVTDDDDDDDDDDIIVMRMRLW